MKGKSTDYKPLAIAFFIAILVFSVMVLWPKKIFPVKRGQVWECTMEVIPYLDNHPLEPVISVSYDSVYFIGDDGTIYYCRNGIDSMYSDLDNFTYHSTLFKDCK